MLLPVNLLKISQVSSGYKKIGFDGKVKLGELTEIFVKITILPIFNLKYIII